MPTPALESPAPFLFIISPGRSTDITMVHKFDQCFPLEIFLFLAFKMMKLMVMGLPPWQMLNLYVSIMWGMGSKNKCMSHWPLEGYEIHPVDPTDTLHRSILTQAVFNSHLLASTIFQALTKGDKDPIPAQ